MVAVPAIFAVLVAAAGWFYLWHDSAASALAGLEQAPLNRLRIRLRRIGGAAMIALAISFYVGFISVTGDRRNPVLAMACLAGVALLLVMVLALALIDIRLTRRLKNQQRRLDR